MSSYDYTMIGDGSAPIALSALREIAVRLDRELVGWLTTVSGAGGPQSSAVWFLREGDSILLYSSSTATRLGNLAAVWLWRAGLASEDQLYRWYYGDEASP